MFASVLILVGAVVAVYRSSVVTSGEPDWVVLAGPALVGLAVGQVVVWLLRLVARLALGRTARGALPGFLAVRRLARVADAATPAPRPRRRLRRRRPRRHRGRRRRRLDRRHRPPPGRCPAAGRAGRRRPVLAPADAEARPRRRLADGGRPRAGPGQRARPPGLPRLRPLRGGGGRLLRWHRGRRRGRPGGPPVRRQPDDRHRRHGAGHGPHREPAAVRRDPAPGQRGLPRRERRQQHGQHPPPHRAGRGSGQRVGEAEGVRGRLLGHRPHAGPVPRRLRAPLAAHRPRLRRGGCPGAHLAATAEPVPRRVLGRAHPRRGGTAGTRDEPPARGHRRGGCGAPLGPGHGHRDLGRGATARRLARGRRAPRGRRGPAPGAAPRRGRRAARRPAAGRRRCAADRAGRRGHGARARRHPARPARRARRRGRPPAAHPRRGRRRHRRRDRRRPGPRVLPHGGVLPAGRPARARRGGRPAADRLAAGGRGAARDRGPHRPAARIGPRRGAVADRRGRAGDRGRCGGRRTPPARAPLPRHRARARGPAADRPGLVADRAGRRRRRRWSWWPSAGAGRAVRADRSRPAILREEGAA